MRDVEYPYAESDKKNYDQVTVKEMIEMLKKVPGDYEVSFDSGYGSVHKRDFAINHDNKKISIND